jgi:hypothetical protein
LGGTSIGVGAGWQAEASYRDASHKRNDHDLEMGRAIGTVNRMVHWSLPLPSLRLVLGTSLAGAGFRTIASGPKIVSSPGELFRRSFGSEMKKPRHRPGIIVALTDFSHVRLGSKAPVWPSASHFRSPVAAPKAHQRSLEFSFSTRKRLLQQYLPTADLA